MKKIPTVFARVFENHRVVAVTGDITPGCEEAFLYGDATVKIDGACCAVIDGVFYKRYDAKKGKNAPVGAIPCGDADPVTGHHPHWVKVDNNKPDDKWFCEAFYHAQSPIADGTYEAIGKHFNGNPYSLGYDTLEPHGVKKVDVARDYDHIRQYLEEHNVEGLVFWLNGEPVCKIKRSDFGLAWPVRN